MKKILFLMLLFIFTISNVYGADVILMYNASSGATGYKICFGKTSRGTATTYVQFKYTYEIDVKNVTTYAITGFDKTYGTGTFYFAAVAYNASGISDYSNTCTVGTNNTCDPISKEVVATITTSSTTTSSIIVTTIPTTTTSKPTTSTTTSSIIPTTIPTTTSSIIVTTIPTTSTTTSSIIPTTTTSKPTTSTTTSSIIPTTSTTTTSIVPTTSTTSSSSTTTSINKKKPRNLRYYGEIKSGSKPSYWDWVVIQWDVDPDPTVNFEIFMIENVNGLNLGCHYRVNYTLTSSQVVIPLTDWCVKFPYGRADVTVKAKYRNLNDNSTFFFDSDPFYIEGVCVPVK